MRDDFFDLGTVSVPRDTCLVCGATDPRTAGTCIRCGATDADAQTLLRAASVSYASARDAALAGDLDAARTHLSAASSLGLAQFAVWHELHDLLNALDPVVPAQAAHDYAVARHLSLGGRYEAAGNIALPETPVARELRDLCCAGAVRVRQEGATRFVRYGLLIVLCALLAGC